MSLKVITFSLLLLPAISIAGQTQRNEFLGVQPAQLQLISDVKVDCRGRSELYPEMDIEVMTNVKNKKELFKASIVSGSRYPEKEVTISRNGVEVCRYLTKTNISSYSSDISLTIIDKMSLNGKFCEGREGKKLPFFPSSIDSYLQYYVNLGDLTAKCAMKGSVGDKTREYLSRPLLKAGPVPEEITFLGMIKSIFN